MFFFQKWPKYGSSFRKHKKIFFNFFGTRETFLSGEGQVLGLNLKSILSILSILSLTLIDGCLVLGGTRDIKSF